jgi:acyl-CoA reductase-like NAD-dependent aldehyde dehydrogenase
VTRGGVVAGKLIQRYATESNMKKVTLELGGAPPFLVHAICRGIDPA